MVVLGTTSDIIVAGMLALSQLIVPVPEQGVQKAEAAAQERNACDKSHEDFSEAACFSDRILPQVVRYQPKPLDQLLKLSNQELAQELNLICYALQDRVFLDQEAWMNGQTSNRADLSNQLALLKKDGLQAVFEGLVKEAATGEFSVATASTVLTSLCHWKVNIQTAAERIDFTGAYQYLRNLQQELPQVDQLPELPQANFVFDSQNHRIGEIYDKQIIRRNGQDFIGGLSRRRLVSSAEMPPMLMNAFMAIEDKRFLEHNGFDFEAFKAVILSGGGGGRGGSTFTMQLIKNAFFGQDVELERAAGKRTLRRKIKELLMIPTVEHYYGKKEILTYYLNLISLTPTAQGVLMAAIDLFDKYKLSDLTIAQMAMLAAMPKGTTTYNPRRFPVAAKNRRDLVIHAMFEQGKISVKERDEALAEPLDLADPVGIDEARVYSYYFTGHLTNYFRDLKREKKSRDPRWSLGGFDIKTSFNLDLQKIVTRSLQRGLLSFPHQKWQPWIDDSTGKNMNVANRMAKPDADIEDVFEYLRVAHPAPETDWVIGIKTPKSSQWLLENGQRTAVSDGGIFHRLKDYDAVLLEPTGKNSYRLATYPEVQGAAVALDNETGDVLAISGGFTAGPYGKNSQNNRATRGMRPPGSCIKPITYLYGLNHGVQPNQMLRDGGVVFPRIPGCNYQWSPGNYRGEGGGSGTVRHALEHSLNRSVANLFIRLAGMPKDKLSTGLLADASFEEKQKLDRTLNDIYDLAVEFGAYPSREDRQKYNMGPPCFPFLIGGGGFETTPLNIAQMYAAIGNGGLKRPAQFLRQVFKGDVPLLWDQSQTLRNQARDFRLSVQKGFAVAPEAFGAIPGVTPQSVAQLRSMMQGVLRRGTAASLANWADLMAGKTGTTNDSRDVWFAGYTNKISVVVWVGYDRNKNLGSATGASGALPIYRSILEGYYQLHPEELEDPIPAPNQLPGVVHAKVDENGRVFWADANDPCGPRWKASPPASGIDEYIVPSALASQERCKNHTASY